MPNSKGSILIVDDNEELLLALRMMLNPHFAKVATLKKPEQLTAKLKQNQYDLILLDMNFQAGVNTGNEGFYWLKEIRKLASGTVVLFITAYGDIEIAVRAMKEGVTDFIEKSWNEEKILSTVLSAWKLNQEKSSQKKSTKSKVNNGLVGSAASIQPILKTVEKVAPTEAAVLITGENGTGKGVFAREIHRLSKRKNHPFISVDVGSLNENLFESELFGHLKGAFTDALANRPGRFELADKGTIFLDEIGNLSPNMQAKLLTVLQDQEVTRVGDNTPKHIDIRLICATNQPIVEMVEEGSFREDLLYRINTIQLDLPPLRERLEDVEGLAAFFLTQLSDRYQKSCPQLSKTALEKMKKHHWAGNIRELEHTLEKALILSEGAIIEAEDLIFSASKNSTRSATINSFNLATHEKMLIENALRKFDGNMSKTSRELGVNRSTLYEKIKKYDL